MTWHKRKLKVKGVVSPLLMPIVSRQEMWPWGHKAMQSFPSGQAGAEFIAAEKKGTCCCDPNSALEVVSSRNITVPEST